MHAALFGVSEKPVRCCNKDLGRGGMGPKDYE
jgi:hypothetical protein